MKFSTVMIAGALALAGVTHAFAQPQVLVGETFASAPLTSAPTNQLSLGAVTITSNQPALEIVSLEDGTKVLRFRPKRGAWVRVAFAPTTLKAKQAISLQAQVKYPAGAPDKGAALRVGIYALTDAASPVAVAEDVGFAALTNPGAAGDTPGTTFLRDNATANSEGKFPGFLGGGPGTSPGGNPGPVLNFGTAWTELFFALSPTNDKPAAPWTATYLVGKAGAPMKNQASFKESKEFVSPAFNVAGLSVGPGDELLIRSLTIAVIGK